MRTSFMDGLCPGKPTTTVFGFMAPTPDSLVMCWTPSLADLQQVKTNVTIFLFCDVCTYRAQEKGGPQVV